MGNSDRQSLKSREIAIVCYPGVQMAAVLGLTDLLQFAAGQVQSDGAGTKLVISRWECHDPTAPPRRLPIDNSQSPEPWPSALVLPPALGPLLQPGDVEALVRWIAQAHARGCIAASACAGAFLLAQAGLLDHRPATTHWAYDAAFRARFAAVLLDTDQLLIDDGDVITAGGIMAWTDLGLRLVDRFLGVDTMLATARAFLIDPPGREQSKYRAFVPQFDHGDPAVLKAQRWLHENRAVPLRLGALSQCAGLEPRTLQRRFHKATGMTPALYVQHLRVARAQDLLLASERSTDQIAWEIGYRDPASFRKIFFKLAKITPSDYRRKFRQGAC
jgi:transcriptional regulator GlxA family with amidase domain